MKKLSILLLLIVLLQHSYAQRKIHLADIYKKNIFKEKTIKGLTSTNNGKYYTAIKNGKLIVKYSYKSNRKIADLFSLNEQNAFHKIDGYKLSKDDKKLLIFSQKERIYRHSFRANYFVWDIERKLLTRVSDEKIQVAEFSPDASKVAYVKDNNLYIFEIATATHRQITFDGAYEKIINGIPDWVYEEEFGYSKGFEWLSKGRFIAYQKFDESQVRNFNLISYAKASPQTTALYPTVNRFKYPKAGEDNAKVSLHVYDTQTQTTHSFEVGEDTYMPRIIPTQNPGELLMLSLGRRQNTMHYIIVNAHTNKTDTIYTENEEQYIDENNFDFITFIDKNSSFIFLSEKSGFNHIYFYEGDKKKVSQVTRGNWDVKDFYGYRPERKMVFYQAATNNPMQREVFSKHIHSKKGKQLSPNLGYNSAHFNSQCSYFINFHSTMNQPSEISLFNANGKKIRTLENNSELKQKLSLVNIPVKNFMTLPSAQKDITLNAWMVKPLNFDERKKYPLVVLQYSGPNSQKVLDRWQFDWVYYLTQQGYIVVCVDPRGTGARGERFRKSTYLQLGNLETQDVIAAAEYLAQQSYIDKDNIAVWGWSYGGFISSSCLFKSKVFNVAISVAPVTNWRYYDTIYTERFMRKPQENPAGYDDNSPINMVGDFSHGNLLLVHGTADDNVHLQNTLALSEKLVQANKHFKMHLYQDKNHSIYGGNTRLHLFTLFYNFLEKNMK